MAKTLETLKDEDAALKDMYTADTQNGGELSAEDREAYRDLIDRQREGYMITQAEVRGSQEQTPQQVDVRGVGGATLAAMAVNSRTWRTGKEK